jgi:Flp pilus assembly CpaF family ATPase
MTPADRLWPPPPPSPQPSPPSSRPPSAATGSWAWAQGRPGVSASGPWPHLPSTGDAGEPQWQGEEFSAAVRAVNARLDEELAAADGDATRARLAIAEQVRAWAHQQAATGQLITAADQGRLVKAVIDERFGLGALQPFLDDPEVEEIDVNGPGQVWIHYADGHKEPGPPVAASEDELADKVRRWAARAASAREFSPARPLLNVALGVGVRMAATMSVTARTHVAIRKQRLMDITLADLVGYGTLDETLRWFLAAAVDARLDLLITGGVNAGKTTLMRALCAQFDPAERVITLESERELHLDHLPRHDDVVSFEAREANQEDIGALTLVDMFPQVLRMRPDRVLVGEVRHAEILALLQAIDNGLTGSMTTLHANSGAEVFGRILTLCGYSGHHLDPAEVFRLVGRAIDLTIHLHRDPATGHRYITEICEVLEPAEGAEPALNRIFAPGPDGRAVPTGVTPACLPALEAAGFDRHLLAGHQLGPGLAQGHALGNVRGFSAGGRP